jgi:hypothetical protein
MQQIKIFKSLESDLAALEKEVNTWLAQSHVEVVEMFGNIAPQSPAAEGQSMTLHKGSFAPSDVMLVVLYQAAG